MELALELGMTEAQLKRSMRESELVRWDKFRLRRGLPMRRLEVQLAQIALILAKTAGAKNVNLSDFLLFDEPPDALEAAKDAFGFKPKGRRTK